ncbi:otogelin [Phyllobates terribilis]|uniref:otogelin n=1 Tax=Phyllobates terribilis TaxID=111132 RepID=UPI003CCAD232
MGHSRRCPEGERTLIKKMITEGKTYKEVLKMIGCNHQKTPTSVLVSSLFFFFPDVLSCFNGGDCWQKKLCDCSRYNASGSRCQIIYNTGPERENMCRTWGQYHYETFDGLYFFFPGKFTYDLLRHVEPDEQSFAIQVHNDPSCASHPYSCARSVTLYFGGSVEVTLQNRIVLLNNLRVQLPYVTGALRIQSLSEYTIVTLPYIFSLTWDGSSAIYLKMSPEYVGRTQGLCGNNNWIPHDDLVTSYGEMTENIEEFVNSWREDLPQKSWMNPSTPLAYEPPCASLPQLERQKARSLCASLLQSPFQSCHELVSPLPYTASCEDDLCMSNNEVSTWCRAMAEYARACAHAGHLLQGWREIYRKCEISCGAGLVYSECIACCPTSCQQRASCLDSEISCVDGCYCPEGMILENGTCVHPTECPCDFHGVSHEAGTMVQDQCNNCTCSGGRWVCTDVICPAECSVTGDFHVETFDGRKYTFGASCQYILAKSLSSGVFSVSLHVAPCGVNLDRSCIQSVEIMVYQDQKKQVMVTQSGDILLYSQYKINLPYTDDMFEIRHLSSVFVQVKTAVGLQLLYDRDGLRLYLQVDGRWKDDTTGLCGTFNDNTQDDFLSPAGVPENTPQLFGNGWKMSSTCGNEQLPTPLDPCDVHLQAASYAAESCSIVSRELFAPCHPYLSPVSYYEQCRRDTCKCGGACLCAAIAHYAHKCRHYGIIINFRAAIPDCGISCQDTMVYSSCVSPCPRTCLSLSVPEACDGACVEGCACPGNMSYDTQLSRCVPRNQCPCYFQGIDYHPGEKVITSLGKCLCLDGVMKCESSETVHGCPSGQIYHNCSSLDMDIDLGQEKTCENQLLNVSASSSLPCVSGCVCPRGWVKHGAECLQPDACPCSWKAKDYYPGDIVQSPCHTCVCHHGAFQCSFHPCPSMCTFYGDRHFRTFDGLTFDFVAACKVHLVKVSARVGNFSVTAENVKCYSVGVVCRKVVSISVGRSLILLDDHTGSLSPSSVIDKDQEVHVWQAGFFTFVHFPSEYITVLWDQRTTLHIQAGPQWQGALEGLCGNFDLKTVNEMRTPDDLEVSNSQEFGTSWTIAECLDSPDSRSPCHLNPLREPFAKKECGILLSEVFGACHPVLDVTWFYANCLSDTCGCNRGGDCECFCASVSAYAHQCCQQGITVDWRSPRVCPYDCEFYNKVLGKGPYRLHSHRDQGLVLAVQMADTSVMPMRDECEMPGHTADFMMTPGLFIPKAHDINLVSLELAVRPNFFLHLGSNGTFQVSKWQRSDDFQRRSTFIIHKNRWTAGYSAFESLAKPGHFMRISPSAISLTKYHHSAAFRLSILYRISDSKLHVMPRPTCEWRYDACSSACYQTCRDPAGDRCHSIPRVEGCFPLCPPDMVVDEVTRKCVYFSDCIEPAVNLTMFHITTEHPRVTAIRNVTSSSAQRASGDHSVTGYISRPVSPTMSAASYSSTSYSSASYSSTSYSSTSDAFRPTMESDKSTKLKHVSVHALSSPDALRTMAEITLARLASSGSATSAQSTPAASTQFSHTPVTGTVTSMSPAPGTIPSKVMSMPTTLLTAAQRNVTAAAGSLATVLPVSETVQAQHMLESAKFITSPISIPEPTEPHTSTEQPDLGVSPSLSLPTTTTIYTLVFMPLDKVTRASQSGITSKALETIRFSKDTRQTTVMPTELVTVKEVSRAKYLTMTIGGITQLSGELSSLSEKFTEATTEVPEVFSVLPLTTSLLESVSGYPPSSSKGLVTTSIATNQPTSEKVTTSTRPSTMETDVTAEEASSIPHTPPSERTRLAPILSASSQAAPVSEHSIHVLTKEEGPQSQSLEDLTSEAAKTTITTKMTSWTSLPAKEEPTIAVTSHGTGISTTQMSSRTEPKAMKESTTLVLRNVTGAMKSTLHTGGAHSSTDVPVHEMKETPTQETTQLTSHPELIGLTLLRTSSTSVTMMQELSVTPMPTSAMTLPTPASDHSLSYTSRTTQPTSPATYVRVPISLSPEVSHFGPLVSTHTEEKGLIPYTVSTTQVITSSTPAPSSQHSVTSTVPIETSSISTEQAGTILTSDTITTKQRDLSSPEASNATSHVTSASQSLTVYETAAYRPSAKAWPSITLDKPSSVVSGSAAPSSTVYHPSVITTSLSVLSPPLTSHSPVREQTVVTSGMGTRKPPSTSQKESEYSTWTEASPSALQPGPHTSSLGKATDVPVTPLLLTHDIHADGAGIQTATPSPSITNRPQYRLPPMTEATSPHLPMKTSSKTFNQTETVLPALQSSTPGILAELTVSSMLSSREAATSQTCTPYTENECIKHICVDGQLIQVNKSQHCPYNVTQSSCGLLGFAVQINGDRCCPKWECPCRCSIFSDLSFVTFDGRYLALYKEASYIMTLTEDESITVQVSRCGHMGQVNGDNFALCSSVLELTYEANQIIIDRLRRKVAVNSRNAWPMVRKYGYKIVDTGNMYLIDTPSDVQIQWFHSTGLMIIESNSTSRPSSMGLCGFCDGNATNDFTLPNGRVLSMDDDPEEFLDSWQVPYTLKYVGKERHRDVNCTVMDCSECMWMILNLTFSSCHPYVSPETFCELWVQDADYTRDLCKALTAYSAMCHKFNVCIEWRRPDFCHAVRTSPAPTMMFLCTFIDFNRHQSSSANEELSIPASTNEKTASTNEKTASTNEKTASTNEKKASTNEKTASTGGGATIRMRSLSNIRFPAQAFSCVSGWTEAFGEPDVARGPHRSGQRAGCGPGAAQKHLEGRMWPAGRTEAFGEPDVARGPHRSGQRAGCGPRAPQKRSEGRMWPASRTEAFGGPDVARGPHRSIWRAGCGPRAAQKHSEGRMWPEGRKEAVRGPDVAREPQRSSQRAGCGPRAAKKQSEGRMWPASRKEAVRGPDVAREPQRSSQRARCGPGAAQKQSEGRMWPGGRKKAVRGPDVAREPHRSTFLCPPSLIYRACLPICEIPLTCQNHQIELYGGQSCSALTEGCVCAEGDVLHRPYNTVCISERKCACTDATGTPREIGEVWRTSNSGCCAYRCVDNDTIIPVQHNCSNMEEPQCRRHGQVLVTVTREQTCCPQKLCVCNETLCDGLIPTCHSHEKLTAYYQEDSCCPRYLCECDPKKCDRADGPPLCRQDQTLFAAHTRCNICSDPAPTCRQGELLTVSSNTTERCCPHYQCVCDPSQCPDITCDLGMSAIEMWTPDSCCPYRTCECSCERVQKPMCNVGEILQIDKEFSNSSGNLCNCTIYKCVKDTVCLSKEYGILRPGQTVVQHTAEGLCHALHCTSAIDPVTRYHLINVSTLNCVAKCEANQLYEPPKDMTQCCGRCRNVSCVQTFLNGTAFTQRPGSTWISKCVRYDCTNTPIGPVLVTSAISCPPFNETECIKVGGYVVSFLDGCCKTCKEDGKFCKRVTVRMTIRKNDCRSNTPVNIVSCDGKCPSASIYNYNINTYARFCKCCRELGLQRRVVQLYCSGNSTWVHYAIQEPTDCSCQWS